MSINHHKIDPEFEQLCVHALKGHISQKEKRRLNVWLKQSDENRAFFENYRELWQQTDLAVPPEEYNLKKEWARLSRTLDLESERETTRTSFISQKWAGFRQFFGQIRPAMAVLVVLGLMVGVFVPLFFHSTGMQTHITQSAQKEYIRLPDGTGVWLNSQSELRYQRSFSGQKREVHLSGEAYFAVVPDSKPFVVMTENACTEVLGTAFNVWARHQETRVVVKRGRVRLAQARCDTERIEITKNQTSRIVQAMNPEEPKTVDAGRLIGWMEGRLVFEKRTLSEIIEEIERYYDVQINLIDTSLAQKTLTATFENNSLYSVLSSLSLSLGVRFNYRSEQEVDIGLLMGDAS